MQFSAILLSRINLSNLMDLSESTMKLPNLSSSQYSKKYMSFQKLEKHLLKLRFC